MENGIANRRQNAASRTKSSRERAHIILRKMRVEAELLDTSKGGIGIQVPDSIGQFIIPGGEMEVEFVLCKTELRDNFRVCYNNNNRIGLMYVDGGNFSPQQRVTAWQHKLQRQ